VVKKGAIVAGRQDASGLRGCTDGSIGAIIVDRKDQKQPSVAALICSSF
jgi:hypothetical protein